MQAGDARRFRPEKKVLAKEGYSGCNELREENVREKLGSSLRRENDNSRARCTGLKAAIEEFVT